MSNSPDEPESETTRRDPSNADLPAAPDEAAEHDDTADADRSSPTDADDDRAESRDDADDSKRSPSAAKPPESLTFRITPVALLVVLTVAVCVSPAAAAIPWFAVLYLVPLGLLVWILRVRTTVRPAGVTVRGVTGRRELDWDEIHALHLDERRWVRAVLRDGNEVRLPAVRVRDLPRLAAMSGGRLSAPDESAPDSTSDESG